MLKLILIGTGNVASHLFNTFLNSKEVSIEQVFGRNQEKLKKFSKYVPVTSLSSEIKEADIYIIAVSDDVIISVAQLLGNKQGIIAHTSGSVSIKALNHKKAAVFYPLQTFTKNKKIDFSSIPICLEASNKKDLIVLNKLAKNLSNSIFEVSSSQRKKLHLAAVFANNFTNHLFQISKDLCDSEKLPFDILKPLIYETAKKLEDLNPSEAQTGPAKRNDVETMQQHLEQLKDPIHKKLYQLISESIIDSNEKKL